MMHHKEMMLYAAIMSPSHCVWVPRSAASLSRPCHSLEGECLDLRIHPLRLHPQHLPILLAAPQVLQQHLHLGSGRLVLVAGGLGSSGDAAARITRFTGEAAIY